MVTKKLKYLLPILVILSTCGFDDPLTYNEDPLNTNTIFDTVTILHYFNYYDHEKCRDKTDGTPCSDGRWCNGLEHCENEFCIAGKPTCTTPCDEQHRMCVAECVFDSDCDNGIQCDGEEWCCTWDNTDKGCEKYHCYATPSPCGQPIWSVLTVCDCDFDDPCYDTCRSCQADYECDDRCWCNGEERCGTKDEGINWGLCLHKIGSRPCLQDEVCNEEWRRCDPRIPPECRRDSDCGLEGWCDENGKCHNS